VLDSTTVCSATLIHLSVLEKKTSLNLKPQQSLANNLAFNTIAFKKTHVKREKIIY
jgi:hypothetical protein